MDNGALLENATEILAFDDFETEYLVVPEWGGRRIKLRNLSLAERGSIGKVDSEDPAEVAEAQARWCALAIIKENGAPVFTQEQVEGIARKSAKALDRIFRAAIRLSASDPEALDRLGKGSAPTPSGDSSFSSAAPSES